MSKLSNLSELQECPHCGSVEFYTKQRAGDSKWKM